MGSNIRAVITGTGSFLPARVLTNADLEKMVDTSDEWITTRTGIKERRLVQPPLTCSDMGAEAGKLAIEDAGLRPEDIDLVIAATFTGDRPLPATACFIQDKVGAVNAGAFDLAAACSGFVYGVSCAWGLIAAGIHRNVLVIGVEVLSAFTDYTDRTSCILFGDGAGAAVVQVAEDDGRGILTCELGADGSQADMMTIHAGGSQMPITAEGLDDHRRYMTIRGQEVFKFAANKMQELIRKSIDECELTIDDVKLVVPHQVNTRILNFAATKLGLPKEKMYVNIDRVGNTSAASVPIALDEANRRGLLEKNDVVVLVAFGGGLPWASMVLRW